MIYLLLIRGFCATTSLIRSRYRETNPIRRIVPLATTALVISSTPWWRFLRLAYAPPPLEFLLPSLGCNRMQLDACAHCATRCKYHCAIDSVTTGLWPSILATRTHSEACGREIYTWHTRELCRHAHKRRLNSTLLFSSTMFPPTARHRGKDDVKRPRLVAHSHPFIPKFTGF